MRYGKIRIEDGFFVFTRHMMLNSLPCKDILWAYMRREGADKTGEKQLISFARIVLKNPSVVILDEATSSISSDMEKLIQNALEVMLSGRTSFIVAHRLSTIRSADRILFISNKGIAEEGTHEQLLKQHGLYYNLYKNLNQ